MLIFQRQKLPFENMLCLFSGRWPGGGGLKAKNMLFFSPLGGRGDESQKQHKIVCNISDFSIVNNPANHKTVKKSCSS
jgi:hypothetical protein